MTTSATIKRLVRLRFFVVLFGGNAFAQLIRFALVGCASNLVYVLVFLVFMHHGSQLANFGGGLLSTILANELHRQLTFQVKDRVGWFTAQWEGGGLAVIGLALSATAIMILGDLVPGAGGVATAALVIVVNATVGGLRFLVLRVWMSRSVPGNSLLKEQ